MNDNLLIYYAGHGWYDQDAEQGYCCRSTPRGQPGALDLQRRHQPTP